MSRRTNKKSYRKIQIINSKVKVIQIKLAKDKVFLRKKKNKNNLLRSQLKR